MTPKSLVLYTYFRSSCSARVRTACALKGIGMDYAYVHLLKDEHLDGKYKKMNPNGTVPTLAVTGEDGKEALICQSVAILEFLEEAFPSALPLLPKDPVGRAHVRDLVQIINADTQPVTNMRIIKKVNGFGGDGTQWGGDLALAGLKAFDGLAKQYGGKYSYGDELTLADVVLAPAVEGALRYSIDLDQVPTVKQIYNRIKELDAFRDSDWKHQVDTPEELRA